MAKIANMINPEVSKKLQEKAALAQPVYDPILADKIDKKMDRLIGCKIFECNLPKNACPHCETKGCCAIYMMRAA